MSAKIRWGVLGVAGIAVEKVIPAMQQGEFSEVAAIASRDAAKAAEAERGGIIELGMGGRCGVETASGAAELAAVVDLWINTVSPLLEDAYLIPLKKMKGSMIMPAIYFGHRVPLFLLVKKFITKYLVLMKLFLPIWRK